MSEDLELKQFSLNSPDVNAERLDGEVIVINLVTGRYYSMSGPAADLFTLCTTVMPFSDWWPTYSSAYSTAPDRAECIRFINRLFELEIVIESATGEFSSEISLPADYERGKWTVPVVEEFTDLEDLILVDPIHDTSNLGWPHVNDDSE